MYMSRVQLAKDRRKLFINKGVELLQYNRKKYKGGLFPSHAIASYESYMLNLAMSMSHLFHIEHDKHAKDIYRKGIITLLLLKNRMIKQEHV